jgi:glycosyltransferase involved in cell wall biosynthesis
MMKVAVNTRMLLKNRLEGIGRFTYEITKRIVEQHPEIEFHFLFDRKFDEQFIFGKNVVPHVIQPPARHPLLWYIWFEWSLNSAMNKIKPDLFLSMDGYLSLNSKVPTHLTIHDLAFEHFPDAIPFLVKKYYQHYVPKFAHHANRIATVSNFSKQDIVAQYKIEEQKIDVVHNAASQYFQPIQELEKQKIKQEFSDGKDFLICVSSIHPRKNIVNLLLGFDEFKKHDDKNIQLLLVGDFMFRKNDVLQTLENLQHKNSIIRTGNLSHEKISKLQAAAMGTLYVSLFEGFGIPIIESMQCGVPVITSDCSSMPEVAADAALLVNPTEINSIAGAIFKLSKDESLRKTLIAKGFQRCKDFSWDKSANDYWKSVEKILV